jgi:hypothetical protein
VWKGSVSIDEGEEPGDAAEEVSEGGDEGWWVRKNGLEDVWACHWLCCCGRGRASSSRAEALRLRPMMCGWYAVLMVVESATGSVSRGREGCRRVVQMREGWRDLWGGRAKKVQSEPAKFIGPEEIGGRDRRGSAHALDALRGLFTCLSGGAFDLCII